MACRGESLSNDIKLNDGLIIAPTGLCIMRDVGVAWKNIKIIRGNKKCQKLK